MIVLLAMWVELILGQGEDDLKSNRREITLSLFLLFPSVFRGKSCNVSLL